MLHAFRRDTETLPLRGRGTVSCCPPSGLGPPALEHGEGDDELATASERGALVLDITHAVSGATAPEARRWNAAAFWLLLCGFVWFGYTVSLPAEPSELARAEAAFGIRLEKLELSAGGYLLDVHYRVLDRGKASDLLNLRETAYLMLEKTPVRLDAVGKPSDGTSSPPHADTGARVTLFGNPGRLIKRGDRVTLVLGPFKASGLTVR